MLYKENYFQTATASIICRDKSVVNRELQRKLGQLKGLYIADLFRLQMQTNIFRRSRKIGFTKAIEDFVICSLKED